MYFCSVKQRKTINIKFHNTNYRTMNEKNLKQEIATAKNAIKKMMKYSNGKAFENEKEIMAKLLEMEWEMENNPNYLG